MRFIKSKLCVLGKWDPNEYPVEDLIRGCLLLLEVGIMQPKLQVLGGTVIVDCEGIGMKHARQLTPSVALQAINVMGVSILLFLLFIINYYQRRERYFVNTLYFYAQAR